MVTSRPCKERREAAKQRVYGKGDGVGAAPELYFFFFLSFMLQRSSSPKALHMVSLINLLRSFKRTYPKDELVMQINGCCYHLQRWLG